MAHTDAQLRKTLVDACHILDHYRLVHAYGHASARAADGKTILIKREYEAILRPWEYYLNQSRDR